MLAQIRKAVVAALGGFLGAGASWLAKAAVDGTINSDDVSQAIGAGVSAAVALGYAVYKARNAGTVNGSLPQ